MTIVLLDFGHRDPHPQQGELRTGSLARMQIHTLQLRLLWRLDTLA